MPLYRSASETRNEWITSEPLTRRRWPVLLPNIDESNGDDEPNGCCKESNIDESNNDDEPNGCCPKENIIVNKKCYL